MLRTHGYFDKGKRCYGAHNWGEPRVERMSQASYRLISGVNTDVFTSWVQEILLPNFYTAFSSMFGIDDSRVCRIIQRLEPILFSVMAIQKRKQLSKERLKALLSTRPNSP